MAYDRILHGPWEVGTNSAPRYPGVYIVYAKAWLGEPQVLYIGESNNIASRMARHERREDWEREARGRPLMFYAMHIDSIFERLQLEQELIRHFSPSCNDHFTSKARSPSYGLGSLMAVSAKSDSPSAVSAIRSLARMSTTKERSPDYGLGSLMAVSAKSDSPSAVSAFAGLYRDKGGSRS